METQDKKEKKQIKFDNSKDAIHEALGISEEKAKELHDAFRKECIKQSEDGNGMGHISEVAEILVNKYSKTEIMYTFIVFLQEASLKEMKQGHLMEE